MDRLPRSDSLIQAVVLADSARRALTERGIEVAHDGMVVAL